MVNRLVSVGDDFTLPAAVKAADANLPARLQDTALNATFVPRWKPTTAYLAGDKVLSPGGDVVSAKVNFTSGASFDAANWDYSPTFVPTSVIETAQPAHLTQLTTASDSGKNGMRIVNNANSYGLKVDQSGTGGVHDAVNIAANFAGAHTPLGIVAGNTDFSTVKVTNTAAQVGGQIIAALGTNSARSAGIFGAENHGSGPAYYAIQKPTSTGAGVQIKYDNSGANETYTNRALWVQARHTAGDVIFVENADVAQTAGSLMHLSQQNVGSSAPCLQLSPYGTGPGLKINASGASILLQVGNNFSVDVNGTVRPVSIVNGASFNNASISPSTTGTVITRNVSDGQPVVTLQNLHASSTGDIAQFKGVGSSSIASRMDKNGYFMTRKTTAPADADLATGEGAVWIDPTPGTGGVRWKVKCTDNSILNKSL